MNRHDPPPAVLEAGASAPDLSLGKPDSSLPVTPEVSLRRALDRRQRSSRCWCRCRWRNACASRSRRFVWRRVGPRHGTMACMTTTEAREFWDAHAATFDEKADHGLRDESVRRAWSRMLMPLLPPPQARIADLGCGTGTLSVLLGQAGYDVTGLDLAPLMVAAARQKAIDAGLAPVFVVGDASAPELPTDSFDVVLVRHVLWTLPDPDAALGNWLKLLRPRGRMVLIEGCWGKGLGLTAAEVGALVRRHRREARVMPLDDPQLWGHDIDDERFVVLSRQ